jgi:hypothetical protein
MWHRSHNHNHFGKHFTKWLQLHQRSHFTRVATATAVLATAEALPKGPSTGFYRSPAKPLTKERLPSWSHGEAILQFVLGSHNHNHFAKLFTKWLQLHQRSHFTRVATATAVLGTTETLPKGPLVSADVVRRQWSSTQKLANRLNGTGLLMMMNYVLAPCCTSEKKTFAYVETCVPATACRAHRRRVFRPVRLAGGWWLVLVCSERKVLLAGSCWLICSERKVLLAGGW